LLSPFNEPPDNFSFLDHSVQRRFNRRGPRDSRKRRTVSPRPVENIVSGVAARLPDIQLAARTKARLCEYAKAPVSILDEFPKRS